MFNGRLNIYTFFSIFMFISILFSSDMGFAAPIADLEPRAVTTRACVRVVIKTRIRIVANGTTSTSTASRTSTRCVTKTAGVEARHFATDIPTIEVTDDA
ncbi:hypothetical protein TWF225_006022 [Orbilia oligospora]|uniref:Uncharacterized protein n=1 Tax=Orbilia oligospora TaxID=2813651 RepID=A0A7C8TUW2_ORBOL|nr:hypothetical protein TWF751_000421 [Orbilia oligospora]KAF3184345.1 hypothetical protein TWF225_006022 [Orbilia oligospora]KAF3253396.1 hypothetical protein TWF128_006479 [Orbilia oligospora]KAF3257813.1 hypothetical protein TWF217_005917 [Orbilia oligospora]KAF3294985.1 hypothetical protein TWF132_002316 [Orbilia oligospora]